MRKFRDMDKRAIVENSVDTLLDTIHQNAITNLTIYAGSKLGISKLCTTGMDGKMVIWNLKVNFCFMYYVFICNFRENTVNIMKHSDLVKDSVN